MEYHLGVKCLALGHVCVRQGMTFTAALDRPVTATAAEEDDVADSDATGDREFVHRTPYQLPTAALRKSVTYTNGESLVLYFPLADWVYGNPGYVGLYQVRQASW